MPDVRMPDLDNEHLGAVGANDCHLEQLSRAQQNDEGKPQLAAIVTSFRRPH